MPGKAIMVINYIRWVERQYPVWGDCGSEPGRVKLMTLILILVFGELERVGSHG